MEGGFLLLEKEELERELLGFLPTCPPAGAYLGCRADSTDLRGTLSLRMGVLLSGGLWYLKYLYERFHDALPPA